MRDNLPKINQSQNLRQKAECEFCSNRHTSKEEFCDLKLNEIEVNSDVAFALSATVGQIVQTMIHKRRLVLAVVFKTSAAVRRFDLNELSPMVKSLEISDLTPAERIKNAPNLKSCFTGFSQLEFLTGNDQWFCP